MWILTGEGSLQLPAHRPWLSGGAPVPPIGRDRSIAGGAYVAGSLERQSQNTQISSAHTRGRPTSSTRSNATLPQARQVLLDEGGTQPIMECLAQPRSPERRVVTEVTSRADSHVFLAPASVDTARCGWPPSAPPTEQSPSRIRQRRRAHQGLTNRHHVSR